MAVKVRRLRQARDLDVAAPESLRPDSCRRDGRLLRVMRAARSPRRHGGPWEQAEQHDAELAEDVRALRQVINSAASHGTSSPEAHAEMWQEELHAARAEMEARRAGGGGGPAEGRRRSPRSRRSPRRGSPRSSSPRSEERLSLRERVSLLEAELLAEQQARRAMAVDHQAAADAWLHAHRETVSTHEQEIRAIRMVAAEIAANQAKAATRTPAPASPTSPKVRKSSRELKSALREVKQLKRAIAAMEAERASEREKAAAERRQAQLTRRLTDSLPRPEVNSIWQHYKHSAQAPKRYRVVGVARHSETEDVLVAYRALYGERELWVRPLQMWCEEVTVPQPWPDGQELCRPRFVIEQHAPRARARQDSQTREQEDDAPSAEPARYRAVVQVLVSAPAPPSIGATRHCDVDVGDRLSAAPRRRFAVFCQAGHAGCG